MFCFPQMGIISLFGSRADSSGSRRGLGVGGLRAAGSSKEQTTGRQPPAGGDFGLPHGGGGCGAISLG